MKVFFLLTILFSTCLQAMPVDECLKKEESLVGISELDYYLWDVYQLAYYQNKEIKKLHLFYEREVKAKHSREGWKKGLKKNIKDKKVYKQILAVLSNASQTVKENDCYQIHVSDINVQILLNNKIILNKDSKFLSQYVLSPWLGEYPIDNEIKRQLLGQN